MFIEGDFSSFSDLDIGAMWFRRDVTVEAVENEKTPEADYIANQTCIHVNGIFRQLADRIASMNHPMANWRCSSKIHQSLIAEECGLRIPDTYQGGGPTIARDFLDRQQREGNEVCQKALEAMHLKMNDGSVYAQYTSLFKDRPLDSLESLKLCPVVLQAFIRKEYEIRATVVDSKVFSCLIDTSTACADARVDWRHYDWANTPYRRIELPGSLLSRLIAVVKKLGLVYGAIDLIKSTDGEYYFLEVNSQGQWLWVEDLTGLGITDAIVDWLVKSASV